MYLVAVDRGHGIDTLGKAAPGGIFKEWESADRLARRIVTELQTAGLDAVLVVPEVDDVSLPERVRRVNALCTPGRQVLLLSIHHNAAGCGQWMTATGWEAWTSPGQTKADELAEDLYKAAARILPAGTKIRTDTTDGDSDKEARFYILTKTSCPAVLTENLFMDSREDLARLQDDDYREKLVRLHVEGVLAYVKRNSGKS